MDVRRALVKGDVLVLGMVTYEIIEMTGCGANAIVYKATYQDQLLKEKNHIILIKELFPFHKDGMIYRNKDGYITCMEQAADYYAFHKKNFLRGIMAHLTLQECQPDKSTLNINSYEYNGTIYTILGNSGAFSLKEAAEKGALHTLYDIAAAMLNVLAALEPFHTNGMLHLDISPDNILFMPLDKGKSERYRNVLLIDYNSVRNLEELAKGDGEYYSAKEHYSAPEVLLQDFKSISPASDIFSVCAIFLEYLQGKPLETEQLSTIKKPIAITTDMLRDCPATVVYKVMNILTCGLRVVPTKRYQSIKEISEEFNELLNRIEGIGVTHSALWEISVIDYHKMIENHHAYSYLNEYLLKERITLESNKHSMIIGSSGMGKTTALLHLWKEGIQQYDPSAPVPIYISLSNYKSGAIPFIKGTLLEKLKFDRSTSTINEAMHSLNHLLNTVDEENHPSVRLMLDDLNEVTGDKKGLLLEIIELIRQPGVQVILTSRGERLTLPLDYIELSPLENAEIQDYLAAYKVECPSNPCLMELLGNPMMLSMYVHSCKSRPGNVMNYSSEDLSGAYFESLISSYRRMVIGDEAELLRAEFAINILLPRIANEMKNHPALTAHEMYTVIQKCFSDLQSRSFLQAFPHYIGKVTFIMGGARDAEEWFDHMIYAILKNKFGLLWKDVHDKYHLVQQQFMHYLVRQEQKNQRKLNKEK